MDLFSKNSGSLLPLLLLFSIVLIFSLIFGQYSLDNPAISNFYVRTNDKAIELTWAATGVGITDTLELTILSADRHDIINLPAYATSYVFRDGEHGKKYDFSIAIRNAQEENTCAFSKSVLFLDFAQLPDLPILKIETANLETPSYQTISAPDGYWGMTLKDNEYLNAGISVIRQNTAEKRALGQIKIRGNTSAVLNRKKPYKLKLNQAKNLLVQRDHYADTEWILLPFNYQFKTISGFKVSELCGLEWQPRSMPVNVMLNGDWMGCYLLVESVKVGKNRVDIGKDGFLIENDAYWWSETNPYFKTDYQQYELRYTIHYPQEQVLTEDIVSSILNNVNACEQAIVNQKDNYTDHIDLDSFVSWLLGHDILGTYDSGGSNMYLYKYSLNDASKLKIGPMWDFDSCFTIDDDWSRIHHSTILHYDILLQNAYFIEAYQNKWASISSTLAKDMDDFLTDYMDQYGDSLMQSLELDLEKYDMKTIGCSSVTESAEAANQWFVKRTDWIHNAMRQF